MSPERKTTREIAGLGHVANQLKRRIFATQLRILERVAEYAADPDNPRRAVLTLAGEKPTCRLRVGDSHVLFDRFDTRIEVRAYGIARRHIDDV